MFVLAVIGILITSSIECYSAVLQESTVFVRDLMEYQAGLPLNVNPCAGGVGFADKWEAGVGWFDGYVPRTAEFSGVKGIAMHSGFSCDTLKRGFLKPIKTAEAYDYIFTEPGEYLLRITAESEESTEERTIKITITKAYEPIAEDVKISGEAYTGAVLKEYMNKYVKAYVLPKSQKAPYEGEGIFSEVIVMPQKPQVKNVKISGKNIIGNTLSVNYTYYDVNGDEEGESEIIWEDSLGNTLGKGTSLKLTSSMAGKSIRAGIKVKSVNIPYESDIVYSEYIDVKKNSGTSSGGGGGGFVMTGSNSGSIKEQVVMPPESETEPKTEVSFSDISNHWAKSGIDKIKKLGYINGFPDGTFKPDNKTTFVQFMVMALKSAGFEETEYKASVDGVASDDWYAGFLQTALDKGFLDGYENIELNGEISREDTAVLVDRILGLSKDNESFNCADAESISQNKLASVKKIYSAGIMNGYTDNTFRPSCGLTRAEAVVVIDRVIISKEAADEN